MDFQQFLFQQAKILFETFERQTFKSQTLGRAKLMVSQLDGSLMHANTNGQRGATLRLDFLAPGELRSAAKKGFVIPLKNGKIDKKAFIFS